MPASVWTNPVHIPSVATASCLRIPGVGWPGPNSDAAIRRTVGAASSAMDGEPTSAAEPVADGVPGPLHPLAGAAHESAPRLRQTPRLLARGSLDRGRHGAGIVDERPERPNLQGEGMAALGY